jgi:uncharacterized protein YndB with AHSA1/START domain
MENYNWKQFTKRITINASPHLVYNAWTTQSGLESWFLKVAEFTSTNGKLKGETTPVEKGDRYKWLWHGYDDSVAEQSEILFTNAKDELQFGFSGGCIVKVSVKKEDGETVCELIQTMPMDNEKEQRHFFIECGKGWTFYMTNLKSILEGGVDLRNKNINILNVINA